MGSIKLLFSGELANWKKIRVIKMTPNWNKLYREYYDLPEVSEPCSLCGYKNDLVEHGDKLYCLECIDIKLGEEE